MPNPSKEMPTFKHFFLDAEPLPGKEVFKLSVCNMSGVPPARHAGSSQVRPL